MNKPTVFNYRRYKELKEAYKLLLDENKELKHDMANLEIRCRIAEAMVKELKGVKTNDRPDQQSRCD